MSTTDTRAAFEAAMTDLYPGATFGRFASGRYNIDWVESQWGGWQLALRHAATEAAKATVDAEKGIRTKYADYFAAIERAQEFLRKIAELKFSEPVAKTTDTAGELSGRPKIHAGCAHCNCDPKRTKFCVENCYEPEAEAARQPAPVVAVKTWQERKPENAGYANDSFYMAQEITDLRAALAASQQAAEPVAYMFDIKGDGCRRQLAAIDYDPQRGETIISKRPLMYVDTAPAIQQPQDERAAFEKWLAERSKHVAGTIGLLEVWQARAALAKKGGA